MHPEPSFARSVAAWGNACLRGQLAPEAFDAWWPRTRYVRTLSFRDDATDHCPVAWLSQLRQQGVTRLALEAGMPGAERVIACADAPLSAWRQQWNRIAGATEAPWFDAVFTREPASVSSPAPGRSPDEVLAALTVALEGLVALSERADLEHWGSYFARVLEVARGERVEGDTPLPPTASETAHRLARAANLADVFGGMGSWNDFAPLSDAAAERERSRCSSLLYDAMKAALPSTAEHSA